MNGEDIKWLEKLFDQYKKDQQRYLDEKFTTVGEKIDLMSNSCTSFRTDCRACLDAKIDSVCDRLTKDEKLLNKKIAIGAGIAVVISTTLWALFGTDAAVTVLKYLSQIAVLGM